MKRSTTRISIAATAVLVTTISLTAMAWPGGHRGGSPPDPEHMIERLDRHLDLTDEQETQIEGLIGTSLSESKTDQQRLGILREQLGAQTSSFDAGTAQQAADEVGEITGRMVFRRASTQAGVYQLLDAQQREQFASLQDQRKERRDSPRSHGPRRFN
jgi:Spy/CpxP family protein refolding chaperone